MTKIYIVVFLVIVTTCLLLGGFAEACYPNNDYFQRSGALIVILGVLFGFLDIEKIHMSEYLPESMMKSFDFKLQEARKAGNHVKFNRVYLEILEARNTFKIKLLKFEGAILMVGTFIWGFGDLLWKLY